MVVKNLILSHTVKLLYQENFASVVASWVALKCSFLDDEYRNTQLDHCHLLEMTSDSEQTIKLRCYVW